MINSDRIIYNKLEIAVELICRLYKQDLITDAYIVGSVVRGTAKETSDIDIYVINPDFKKQIISVGPEQKEESVKKLVDYLKTIDVEFKLLPKRDIEHWYQFYKGEPLHMMYSNEIGLITANEYMKITRSYCNGRI